LYGFDNDVVHVLYKRFFRDVSELSAKGHRSIGTRLVYIGTQMRIYD